MARSMLLACALAVVMALSLALLTGRAATLPPSLASESAASRQLLGGAPEWPTLYSLWRIFGPQIPATATELTNNQKQNVNNAAYDAVAPTGSVPCLAFVRSTLQTGWGYPVLFSPRRSVDRTCNAPISTDTQILIPLFVDEQWFSDPARLSTSRSCYRPLADGGQVTAAMFTLTVDGVDALPPVGQMFTEGTVASFVAPQLDLTVNPKAKFLMDDIEASQLTYLQATGYFALVGPFSPGQHVLTYSVNLNLQCTLGDKEQSSNTQTLAVGGGAGRKLTFTVV